MDIVMDIVAKDIINFKEIIHMFWILVTFITMIEYKFKKYSQKLITITEFNNNINSNFKLVKYSFIINQY